MILGEWPTWCTNSLLCIYFYLQLSTSFEHTVFIIRRDNCFSAASGNSLCGGRDVCRLEESSSFRMQVGDLHTKRSPTQSDMYQRLYWYNWFSWWWARGCSKHVENWNKYIGKNCASIWSFTMKHYICILVLFTMKMATWVAETCRLLWCNKNYIHKSKYICWSFKNFYTSD